MTTQKKLFSSLTLSAIVLSSSLSQAADFIELTIQDYGNVPAGAPQTALDAAVAELETEINSNFPDIDLDPFTKGTAKAAALASSGIGTEYASDFSIGLVGFNLGVASDATASQIQNLIGGQGSIIDVPGLGGAIALTVGLNFKNLPAIPFISDIFSPDRTRGYLAFLSTGKKFTPDDPLTPSFEFGNTIFAAQGQYKLVPGMSVGLGTLKWGGVDIGGGLRYANSYVNVTKSLAGLTSAPQNMGSGLGNVTTAFTGDAVVGVNVKTFSIPVEISTSARLLHVLGLFVGGGADINLGSASSSLSIDSPVEIDSSGGSLEVSGVNAQATAGLNATGKPTFTNLKYFGGLQAEILAIAVSVQYTGSIVDSSKAINLGIKAFW